MGTWLPGCSCYLSLSLLWRCLGDGLTRITSLCCRCYGPWRMGIPILRTSPCPMGFAAIMTQSIVRALQIRHR